jgi:hypothetical protein
VTDPDEALEAARRAAAARRAEGGYAGAESGGALDETFTSGTPSIELLSQWAVIEVDESVLYSTRRAGVPVTALKRLLVRLLRQYFVEAEARQTRFNIAVLSSLRDMEKRLERLEEAHARRERE